MAGSRNESRRDVINPVRTAGMPLQFLLKSINMNINKKIKELEHNPELMAIGGMIALFGLWMLYKLGVLIGGLSYQVLN
jgi:hypothetical protein